MRRWLSLPYSPDLAPADFFLFPKFESSLKGRRFRTVEEREENSIWGLCAILQNVPGRVPELEKALGEVYQEWREYFEGYKFKL